MEDPFALKIKELSSLGDTTRIMNALRGNDFEVLIPLSSDSSKTN